MKQKPENSETPEAESIESVDDLGYDEIGESSKEKLFKMFRIMRPEGRINEVTAFCLATALAKDSGIKNEETRLEYLKEYGRNERAILKSDGPGANDDDDPLFSR